MRRRPVWLETQSFARQLDRRLDRQRLRGHPRGFGRDRHRLDRLAHQFVAIVAEELLRLRVDEDNGTVRIDHDDGIGRRFDDQAKTLLRAFALADIADDADEMALVAGQLRLGHRDVHGKQGAVLAHPQDLPAYPNNPLLAGGQVAGQALPVGFAQRPRNDALGHLATQHFLPAVAERALGRRVEFDDPTLVVDADDAIERRLEHRGLAGLALAHRLLRSSPHPGDLQMGTKASQQHPHAEGPRQVIARAGFDVLKSRIVVRVRPQEHDRDRAELGVAAQCAQERETVDARHYDVA